MFMTNKEMEKSIDDLELQVDSLMEQMSRIERLLTQIQGGLVAMKWLGAILGVLLALWEII